MADLGRVQSVERGGGAGASDRVLLDFEGRLLRRRRLVTESGGSLVVDLPETTSLEDGDALVLESGARVAVVAADEPLLEVTGPNLPRLAWHIGNRHTPCRIEADRLFIRDDHVLADMLRQLGAEVVSLRAPFSPEGGAYGHGRTMGHDHEGAHGLGHHSHATLHE
jgi:urease accessory protein